MGLPGLNLYITHKIKTENNMTRHKGTFRKNNKNPFNNYCDNFRKPQTVQKKKNRSLGKKQNLPS